MGSPLEVYHWVVQAQASSGASLAALILFETLGLCGWLDPASSQRTFLPRPELATDLSVVDSTTTHRGDSWFVSRKRYLDLDFRFLVAKPDLARAVCEGLLSRAIFFSFMIWSMQGFYL